MISNTNNVLRFSKKKTVSVLLEPNVIRGVYMGCHVHPTGSELRYDHISIYTGYIQGGLGAINLD